MIQISWTSRFSGNIIGHGVSMNKQIDLNIFSHSKFRTKFRLDEYDLALIKEKGMDVIRSHALRIVKERISQAIPSRDGKQTPFKGHPVFKAQHATATCCRNCLEKWHKIPKGRALTITEIDYIVLFIMKWIEARSTSASELLSEIRN